MGIQKLRRMLKAPPVNTRVYYSFQKFLIKTSVVIIIIFTVVLKNTLRVQMLLEKKIKFQCCRKDKHSAILNFVKSNNTVNNVINLYKGSG